MEQEQKNTQPSVAQQTLLTPRRCGHQLHHNMTGKDQDAGEILSCLSEEEQKTLKALLDKCLQAWGK